MSEQRYQVEDLLYLMARLRDPQSGCPWDLQQDFHSIVPHTLEEAYEVADAIERKAWDELPGELGDLLFQVVYYAQFGQEQERFGFADVVDGIVRKLVRRHPHVFPGGDLRASHDGQTVASEEVPGQWQAIKAQEKREQGRDDAASVLADVPLNLPAMTRAVKLQKKAARTGFDWDGPEPVLAKIHEELAEVHEALASGSHQALEHEIGDLLFAVTNLARHAGIDPEQAVRGTNQRFCQRFAHIEQQVAGSGRQLEDCSLQELDALWDEAKRVLSRA
ncbi:nucleoside triphosphate pyrophosphohydrolase [Thiopseudomonas denitrificans]|uniref:Nucleoside triphosphate pyrophosphohydrolase n=1 Tax=Thiopseudomonas denitrificans TaxID=1501432 RepID=A0A4R6TZS9_9GAMM|nr:nucleoside triphosphate pyrophosphohydrolase [Thiopseudomonas denitrificans]TDQ39490.1 ATP diphosphatase [Thiopseudomonas denitrificans]